MCFWLKTILQIKFFFLLIKKLTQIRLLQIELPLIKEKKYLQNSNIW